MEDFFPETYRLDVSNERQAFFTLFDGEQPGWTPDRQGRTDAGQDVVLEKLAREVER